MAQQFVERVGVRKHNYARTGRMVGYGGRESLMLSHVPHTLADLAPQWSSAQPRLNGINS